MIDINQSTKKSAMLRRIDYNSYFVLKATVFGEAVACWRKKNCFFFSNCGSSSPIGENLPPIGDALFSFNFEVICFFAHYFHYFEKKLLIFLDTE